MAEGRRGAGKDAGRGDINGTAGGGRKAEDRGRKAEDRGGRKRRREAGRKEEIRIDLLSLLSSSLSRL